MPAGVEINNDYDSKHEKIRKIVLSIMNQPDCGYKSGYKSLTFTWPHLFQTCLATYYESEDSADAQIYSIRMSRLIGFTTAGYEKLDAFLYR
jgi:hypothetical protein